MPVHVTNKRRESLRAHLPLVGLEERSPARPPRPAGGTSDPGRSRRQGQVAAPSFPRKPACLLLAGLTGCVRWRRCRDQRPCVRQNIRKLKRIAWLGRVVVFSARNGRYGAQ